MFFDESMFVVLFKCFFPQWFAKEHVQTKSMDIKAKYMHNVTRHDVWHKVRWEKLKMDGGWGLHTILTTSLFNYGGRQILSWNFQESTLARKTMANWQTPLFWHEEKSARKFMAQIRNLKKVGSVFARRDVC